MPENDVWPPKPSLPEPLAEYDELIETSLPTLSAKTVNYNLVLPETLRLLPGFYWLLHIISRLSPETPKDQLLLIQVLREETRLDFWQARAIVQSYYKRHGLEPTKNALLKTLILPLILLALTLVAVFAIFLSKYLSFHRNIVLSQPNHGTAIIALDNEKALLQVVSFTLLGLVYAFWLIRYSVIRIRSSRKS